MWEGGMWWHRAVPMAMLGTPGYAFRVRKELNVNLYCSCTGCRFTCSVGLGRGCC